jgi:hypothetical protein
VNHEIQKDLIDKVIIFKAGHEVKNHLMGGASGADSDGEVSSLELKRPRVDDAIPTL